MDQVTVLAEDPDTQLGRVRTWAVLYTPVSLRENIAKTRVIRYARRSDTVPRAASGMCVCGCLRPSCGLDDELVSLTCRITLGLSALEFTEHRHKRCRFDTTYHFVIDTRAGRATAVRSGFRDLVNQSGSHAV